MGLHLLLFMLDCTLLEVCFGFFSPFHVALLQCHAELLNSTAVLTDDVLVPSALDLTFS